MNVTVIAGYHCSGKTYLASRLCAGYNSAGEHCVKIEVSDFVKDIAKEDRPELLQDTKKLDTEISRRILMQIMEYGRQGYDHTIVVGPRQVSICKAIQIAHSNVEFVWVSCDKDVRMERFRKKYSVEGQRFIQKWNDIESGNVTLGIFDVKALIFGHDI